MWIKPLVETPQVILARDLLYGQPFIFKGENPALISMLVDANDIKDGKSLYANGEHEWKEYLYYVELGCAIVRTCRQSCEVIPKYGFFVEVSKDAFEKETQGQIDPSE